MEVYDGAVLLVVCHVDVGVCVGVRRLVGVMVSWEKKDNGRWIEREREDWEILWGKAQIYNLRNVEILEKINVCPQK